MLKARGPVFALIALFAISGMGMVLEYQSHHPSPSERKEGKPPQKQTKGGQQPTAGRNQEGATPVGKINDAPSADIGARNNTKKDDNGTSSEWWMALFTLGLVGVGAAQLFLFLVQLRLIRESLNDAKVAAEAARDSAKAAREGLVASNRPRLAIREPRIMWRMSKNGCTIVNFVLQNFGGSGAHIIESVLDVQLTIGGSPTLPILTALHQDIIPGTFLNGGKVNGWALRLRIPAQIGT